LANDAPSDQSSFKHLILPQVKYNSVKDVDGKEVSRRYNPKYFRIKVVSGWSEPTDKNGVLFSGDLKKLIRKTSQTIYLNLLDHELNFNDDGSAELTVNYVNALENTLDSDELDLLKPTKSGLFAKDLRNQVSSEQEKLRETNKVVGITSTEDEEKKQPTTVSLRTRMKQTLLNDDHIKTQSCNISFQTCVRTSPASVKCCGRPG
jgi:hypothetical protein